MKHFNKKKILVTGGAGFIGSHLVKKFVDLNAIVTVIVKYNSIIDCPRISKYWDKIKVIEADLRNVDSVLSFKKLKFDYIFHLAAYNHVGDSFKHVTENINSNFISTVNLMDHGPEFKKFIHIGSSEIYGLQKKVPFDVKEMPNPMSPYSLAKLSSESYVRLKARKSKIKIVCIRPFNTFGPYQSEKAIIPEIIIKCLLGKEIKTTLGIQTREFNYIDNIIDGFLLIAKKINNEDIPINLGSNRPIKIRDLVKKIHSLTYSTSVLKIGSIKYRPNEIWKMQANNKFITNKLKWKPEIDFNTGLIKTINWYKNFLKLYNIKNLFIKLQ
jgi:UDP-glucose 4-epimerase